jgi:hypothetical protein
MITNPADLIAAFGVANQEVARDRRALIAASLAEALGSQGEAARALDLDKRTISDLCIRAAQVRADPARTAAVDALIGHPALGGQVLIPLGKAQYAAVDAAAADNGITHAQAHRRLIELGLRAVADGADLMA